MAIARLTLFALLAVVSRPAGILASGGFDDTPPFTLPYYLDRLPAKPPSLIFQETYPGVTAATAPLDFKAALLDLATRCEAGGDPAALLAYTDHLLTQARLEPKRAAALCNVLNDARDLFAAAPPVTGKPAADYLRWRARHADWFHLTWDDKPDSQTVYETDEAAKSRRRATLDVLDQKIAGSRDTPLRVHWLYLRGAYQFPGGGEDSFQMVATDYPDHPRAEAARFMLARCRLVASRRLADPWRGPTPAEEAAAARERPAARALFEDYLERYPQGRFAADVPGWLGGLAFAAGDYLGALEQYIRQADVPGHPEVLKSAGFMCERCLSRLSEKGDQEALRRVAGHPRLAMSLIYLLVNTAEADNYDGQLDEPARVNRWRRALLPRLADEVARHRDAYTAADWQPRYLAILAQAASGEGDQAKALTLCGAAGDGILRSDDLAFIRLVALGRARRLPEAIAAGREFARLFPQSPLAPGAALRLSLALLDDHQAGAALIELYQLRWSITGGQDGMNSSDRNAPSVTDRWNNVYPSADGDLTADRSVLRRDTSGAENEQLGEIIDALLNFAPLPELAAALSPEVSGAGNPLEGADEINLRATLVQRWLGEEENFAEAGKYATPAQWSLAAAGLEKLTAEAEAASAGEARAAACLRLANGWAGARGKLTFAPLETDQTRGLFIGDSERAGLNRRENGLALGVPAAGINRALSGRDEWGHAFHWWLEAADAAPAGSTTRATALWSALRAMPAIALASPYTFTRAGETDASGLSRRLCERLLLECPRSREAREFAVYYDLAPPERVTPDNDSNSAGVPVGATSVPDLSGAMNRESLPYDEPEYHWRSRDQAGQEEAEDETPYQTPYFEANQKLAEACRSVAAFSGPDFVNDPPRLAGVVAAWRARLREIPVGRSYLVLVNFLDDLGDFLQEPAVSLTPGAVRRYVDLRLEILRNAPWRQSSSSQPPEVPEATGELAPFRDYLDFLDLAIVANQAVGVTVPGQMEDSKDADEPGKQEPVTYGSRDYPKLAAMASAFLADYPRSRKREAARLLQIRALYAASRPRVVEKFAVWPESGHFESGRVVITHRQQPFDPVAIRAALDAYDREFPGDSRYATDIRNLRGLLAWRTCDWPAALELTLQTAADSREPVLQSEGIRRRNSIFVDGLTDENERARCLAAIKATPGAAEKLREFLPRSPFRLRVLQGWLLAQL